jgi:RNA polymerase sigma factor for flagellar operon FliA
VTTKIDEDVAVIEQRLWDDFEKVRCLPKDSQPYIRCRNALIEFYYHIVEGISNRMEKKLKEITAPEIASYGVDGLIDAIESFDKTRDAKFKTWATIRIRGSVIDNIRKSDWVPRLVRQRHSKLEDVRQQIESANGEASDQELANAMGISIEEFTELARKSTPVAQVSMNAKPKGDNNEDYDELGDIATEAQAASPDDKLLREEMYKKLLGKNFTRPERQIIYLHYYENLTMKEIAEHTGFSESRISQMHADIIRRLKNKVERNPDYANDLQRMLET